MSLREPSWRIPCETSVDYVKACCSILNTARPCPFYQRGNCVFAAKCNFLHVALDKATPPDISISSRISQERANVSPAKSPPVVRVDSPASIHSPPMQRLISALTDVIGHVDDNEEDSNSASEESKQLEPASSTWSEGLPTMVHGADSKFFARVTDTMAEMMRLTDGADDDDNDSDIQETRVEAALDPPVDDDTSLPFPPTSSNSPDTPSIHTTQSSPNVQVVEMPQLPDNHADMLSPVDLSSQPLHSFSLDETTETNFKDTSSIDSGFVDSFQPPRSPNIASTFGVIHSPFGSPSARVLSPRLGPFIIRSPGSPFTALPVEQQQSLEDDLDSPSDRVSSSFSRELVNESQIPDGRGQQSPDDGHTSLDSMYVLDDALCEAPADVNVDTTSRERDELSEAVESPGHPSSTRLSPKSIASPGNPISLHPVCLEDSTSLPSIINAETSSPRCSSPNSSSNTPLDDNDNLEDTKGTPSHSRSEDDSGAPLGYLRPGSASQDGDSFHSLYDAYGSEPGVSPQRAPSSLEGSPRSFRPESERPFTSPPPPGSRTDYRYEGSTPSSSPIPSLSASKGPASPASIASSSRQSLHRTEDELPKKVPFGFRASRSLVSLSQPLSVADFSDVL